ncbi:anthranilate synthase component I [Thermoflavimicrobium daqui]|uniref:Anthranilate synthase component 1 n=2 Tax=Thermoflavimicrobium daqui TaxID=2137476 RepID=A0A364K2U9_9BACL|nr:anthranilate synthase component I [Thermoflavimicrobium daqui]
MIPICKTIIDDMETPISLYHRLPESDYSFLLESVEGEQKIARYSFMGCRPFRTLTGKDGNYTIQDRYQGQHDIQATDPLPLLEEWMTECKTPKYPAYPPFLGGAVGYLSYDLVRYFEPVLDTPPKGKGTGAYDVHLMFYDRLLVYDHFKRQIILVQNILVRNKSLSELQVLYKETISQLDSWYRDLKRMPTDIPKSIPLTEPAIPWEKVTSNVSKETYMDMVEKAKEYIRAGDIFQVVPSQRWTWNDHPSPMHVYRVLRQINPSTYMYYLQMKDETVVGASPELLVKVIDGIANTRPIAGSRPRGRNHMEDEQLMIELLQDPKEIAEHVMLVDLGRNDLGRISHYGTVQVTEKMKIEKYSHIMHIVSHVMGRLKDEYRASDAVRACFPAGTVSGAPKIRAMEIIAELEPEPRGIYAGAIGYFSYTGNVDTCIAIRTIYFRDNKAYIQAGGGVVSGSVPENEYMESVNKATAMLKALEMASQMERMESEQDGPRKVSQGC